MQHGKSKIRSRLLRLSADLMQMGITGGKSISVSTHRLSGSDKGTEFPRRTENKRETMLYVSSIFNLEIFFMHHKGSRISLNIRVSFLME